MLIEFSVTNFLSIKDKVTLSMVASSDDSNPDNLINIGKYSFLKSAVIYGANASGKTNVLKALIAMDSFVRRSHTLQAEEKISELISFKLDENYSDKPSEFDMIFIHEGVKYNYGFVADNIRVYEEYLYYYPKGKPKLIFERTQINNYKFNQEDKNKVGKIIAERNTDNKLFLSTATQWNFEPTGKAFQWFQALLRYLKGHEDVTASQVVKNEEFQKQVLKYLGQADIGIKNFSIKSNTMSADNIILTDVPPHLKDELIKNINNGNSIIVREVLTYHQGKDKKGNIKDIAFNLKDEESDGTQKLFELLGPWIVSLEKGFILVVDELDIRLHPLLSRFLVDLFHNPEINTKNAQLIFTTHDTNLLTLELFRRDQIWFTEKNPDDGSTDLYPLDSIGGVRNDENIRNGYLQGRYGAIPFIGKL